jgi:hypothetical protein
MADLNRDELKRLARLGAVARLAELKQEEAAIRAAFPDLFRGRRRGRVAAAATKDREHPRRKYRMSSAAKKAVSERMTRYWAARRREKAKAAGKK